MWVRWHHVAIGGALRSKCEGMVGERTPLLGKGAPRRLSLTGGSKGMSGGLLGVFGQRSVSEGDAMPKRNLLLALVGVLLLSGCAPAEVQEDAPEIGAGPTIKVFRTPT